MKQLFIILLTITLIIQKAAAQTNQAPKEMIQQIIALKTFLKYAKQGYNIVSSGLRTVNSIKNGDFTLHDLKFDHLQQVSPAVSRYAALSGLVVTQANLILICNKLLHEVSQQLILTKEEQDFCKRSVNMFMNECKQYVDELIQLLTAYALELKDDERINRIGQLKQNTIRLEASFRSLSEEMRLLIRNRINEQRSVQHSKQLNNLQ
ncbi:hypothetical protein IQ13_3440 [Lacibacter cauensis]|uniref:TerB family tellurite resistance protein n=1 Tax=Lacibacter cauensis TaxID=510947 RepID=A0A562SCQ3_9BACT|nr:hypothetical protein [Lacibacter cauensis]TWI79048.1 hypothetical protein IQ13_3440 [Lacibacter cauensis]